LRAMPWTGALFAAGVLALIGLPPFGMFVSEFLLVRAAVAARQMWLAGAMLVLLLTAFISLIGHLNRMPYVDVRVGVYVGEQQGWPVLALAGSAALLVVLGVTLPAFISALITECTLLVP